MKVIGSKIECLQGERFSQIMSGFDFANATQIVAVIFKENSTQAELSFVKVASESYPNAGIIALNDANKMVFNIDTKSLSVGAYGIEVRVDVAGVEAPIVKQKTDFLTINTSRT